MARIDDTPAPCTRLSRLDEHAAAALWRDVRAGVWSIVEERERDGRRFLVARRAPSRALDELTPREREIVGRVVSGRTNKEIAFDLRIAGSTVAGHLTSAMRKLAIPSRVALVRLYRWLDSKVEG